MKLEILVYTIYNFYRYRVSYSSAFLTVAAAIVVVVELLLQSRTLTEVISVGLSVALSTHT